MPGSAGGEDLIASPTADPCRSLRPASCGSATTSTACSRSTTATAPRPPATSASTRTIFRHLEKECPQPPPEQSSDVLPHFLDPVANPLYAFCSCPIGQQDTFARPNFPIYIEDRDEDAERNVDDLYAALLLDPSPSNPNPQTAVRYRIYVNPQDPIPRASSIEYNPIGRADPLLRELRLGNEFRDFDFCNGGSDVPLTEGMHALVVMITDRPWFTPTSGAIQEGVPDLAAGATFDALTYVFSCASSTSERCASQCKPIEELP
jgi:hypothetical protein